MEFTIVLLCVVIVALLAVFFYYCPFFLWISAQVSGVHISLLQLVLMRIRKVPATVIVRALIEAHKAGLSGVTREADTWSVWYMLLCRQIKPISTSNSRWQQPSILLAEMYFRPYR